MIKQGLLFLLLALGSAGWSDNSMESQCADILNGGLAAHNPETRTQAVVALSLASEHNPMVPLLVGMTDDKDVMVRLAVVASLAEVKTKPAVDALHKLLMDTVPEVSFAAAKALFNLHDPAGKQSLMWVAEGESKPSSGIITSEMRQALRMMHTPTTTFLFAVHQGIGLVPLPGFGTGVASLEALLADPGVSGRATAVLLLGKEKDPDLVPALKDALHDKNWTVRAAAVHAIALRDDPGLKGDLVPLLNDEKQGVRLRAAAGILRLSSIEAAHKAAPKKK